MGMLAGRIWRDDGLDPSLGEFLAQAVGIISPVGENSLGPMAHREQATHSDKVVDVAGCDQQDVGAADIIGQRVDFGRLSAARTADGVVEGPPFAPAAERWALMYVESTEADPYIPVDPVNA
jgi:hypothetical protein